MRKVLIPIVAVVLTLAVHADGRAQTQRTSLHISNGSGAAVDTYLTLGADSAGRIGDVRLVDVSTNQPVQVEDVDPGQHLQGRFRLNAGQTVSWDSFGGQRATGAVTFRAFPQSCPTANGPCGVTKGEFAINLGNEAVDISSVDGINAIMAMDLSDGGATPWPSGPGGSKVAQNSGTLEGDQPLWGVFPYRCTICAGIGNAPGGDCNPPNPLGPPNQSYCKTGTEANPQPALCQLNRSGAGGTVKFTFIEAKDPM